MKNLLLVLALLTVTTNLLAQKYITRTGTVYFNAGTGLEEIAAVNKLTAAAIDASTGQMQFLISIKGFEFKSQLMQDHFHENYMESDKYPKSTFKGYITNIKEVNFSRNGSYPVKVKGTLEIHGVKREVETTGLIKIQAGSVASSAKFDVALKDYGIAIPSLVADKLSKTVEIQVNCMYALAQ